MKLSPFYSCIRTVSIMLKRIKSSKLPVIATYKTSNLRVNANFRDFRQKHPRRLPLSSRVAGGVVISKTVVTETLNCSFDLTLVLSQKLSRTFNKNLLRVP